MKDRKTVVVTGGAGYVGSVLTRRLLSGGYKVRVIDSLLFGDDSLKEICGDPALEFIRGDIRDIDLMKVALRGADTVFHLAAYVGEHAYKGQEAQATDVNYKGTVDLIDSANRADIERFVFTSTCSNYGSADTAQYMTEESWLNPVSQYAVDKIAVEDHIRNMAKRPAFNTVICRCATVYGISPRMRFDLLINELVRDAYVTRKIIVHNQASWRPFIHVEDLVDAFITILKAPLSKVSGRIFNIGQDNYTKRDIVAMLKTVVNNATVDDNGATDDKRNYRVSFDRIKNELDFKAQRSIEEEIGRMCSAIAGDLFGDTSRKIYTNYL